MPNNILTVIQGNNNRQPKASHDKVATEWLSQ